MGEKITDIEGTIRSGFECLLAMKYRRSFSYSASVSHFHFHVCYLFRREDYRLKKILFDSLFPIKVTEEATWIAGLIILLSLSRDTTFSHCVNVFKAGNETEWQNAFVQSMICPRGTPISVSFGIPNQTNAD